MLTLTRKTSMAKLLSTGSGCAGPSPDDPLQAVHKDISSLRVLLTHDRTYFRDTKGRTVAHLAAETGCKEALEFIISMRQVACILLFPDRMPTSDIYMNDQDIYICERSGLCHGPRQEPTDAAALGGCWWPCRVRASAAAARC